MNAQELIRAAAEAIVGKMEVEYLSRLLRASGSNNTVEDMFRAAIHSKAKSESNRLSGIVLTRLERQGATPQQRAQACKHLGIGGTRSDGGEQDYLSTIVAGPDNPKVAVGKPNGG